MARAPRHFLYLNSQAVDEYVSQIEGGLYGEEGQRIISGGGRNLGAEGGLAAGPVSGKIHVGRDSSSHDERARTVQQTPESRFARLYASLENEDVIQWLEALDDEIWEQLRRGEIVEVAGVVSVPSLNKAVALAGEFAPLLGVLEAIGEAPQDDDTTEAMKGLGALSGIFGTNMPLIVRAGGSPRFKFVGQINQDNLRVNLGELEGEATMLAKVQRKLRPSEKYTWLESIPAMAALPRDERRKAERDLKNAKELPDMVISPPAAVVTPVAVYR